MAIRMPSRAHFGSMLTKLMNEVGRKEEVNLSAYADVAGVSLDTIKRWRAGVTAPHRDHTPGVQRLVVHLRRTAGEPAEFSNEWRQALHASQWEGEDHRGTSDGRGGRRRALAAYGAEGYAGSACRDRETELAFMKGFFGTGDEKPPYLWWQAQPRAGISVLLTRFVMNPPENADVVAYFASTATGWNQRDHFVGSMVRQLTALMEKKVPRTPEKTSPPTLQTYFRQAASHAAKKGRRLLIVVDGLDRDVAWKDAASDSEPSAGGSIAALLPHVQERKATKSKRSSRKASPRVIVSSRPTLEPPTDVPADHPLRRTGTVRTLRPSSHAKGAASAARAELQPLLASELGRTLAGLLAVTGTGMRTQDLAELANVERPGVERLVTGEGALCLVSDHLHPDGYTLAGDQYVRVLQEEAGIELLDHCTELLHAWADSWKARGWPTTTPRYLLSHYLRPLRQTDRFERFALDPHRQLRLAEEELLDEALAQLDRVLRKTEDLGATARAAFARSLLAGRARLVPKDFPRLFALAGDVVRARELALSPPQRAAKAARLAYVAEVLFRNRKAKDGEAAQERARAVAREAAEWARRATAAVPLGTGADECLGELTESGIKLHACAEKEFGTALLWSVVSCEAVGWADRVRAAAAVRGRDDVGWLVGVAQHAEALSAGEPDEQAEALQIWGQLSARTPDGDKRIRALVANFCDMDEKSVPNGAAAIRYRIKSFCDALDPSSDVWHIDLLALGASALAPAQPIESTKLSQLAQKALLHAVTSSEALSPANRAHLDLDLSTTLARVVQALHDAGQGENAARLPDEIPEALCCDVLGDDVREQARVVTERATHTEAANQIQCATSDEPRSIEEALKSHPARGRRLLAEAFARWEGRTSVMGAEGWGLPLAQSLAVAGYAEEAVRLTCRSSDPAARAGALALVALGCATGGRGGEALRYAQEAAGPAAQLTDPAVRGLVAQAFAHAGAAEPALIWADGGGRTGKEREQVERSRIAVAVGLVPYDSNAAGIVGRQLVGVDRLALVPGRERHLPRVMGLLLALPDPRQPGSDLCAALQGLCAGPAESIQGWDMRAVLFHALLDVSGCCPDVLPVGDKLDRWEQYLSSTLLPEGVLPAAEWAVLHAVRGDAQGARDTAGRASTPEGRAAALAAVATYLAGVPVIVPAADGWAPQDTSVLRFLALADALGTKATRDEHEARRLVREVLAGEHWRYALPLLPRLAPEALPRLAELGLVHGAAGTGERPLPLTRPVA
ncbi:hypothetical protein [Streptomyces microflavus]|uniref:hypothetical protein n=1 Tax=Streptomyces microflavus TaxID=1919 RepID=UPI002E33477A|nr:hypothetical protein [Streptomyces microflavus]